MSTGRGLKALDKHKRVVVKIGSALLVDRAAGLKADWLDAVSADIAALKAAGVEVLVVSSGAIALGRTVLNLASGALKLEESQAAAAVGQIALRARLVGKPFARWHRRRPDPADARRYGGAAPLSECARHDQPASEDGRRPDHQRKRYGRDERNPLWRQ